MKRFDSGTLIPGSTWKAEAESEAEVVRRAVENLKNFHGETEVRPEMVERIKERIVDVDAKGATKHYTCASSSSLLSEKSLFTQTSSSRAKVFPTSGPDCIPALMRSFPATGKVGSGSRAISRATSINRSRGQL